MRPLWLPPALLLGLAALPAGVGESAQPSNQTSSADTIRAWVARLGDDNFAQRQQATQSLLDAGKPAVAPLAAALPQGGLEVRLRGFAILHQFALSEDADVSDAALDALQKLAASSDRRLVGGAKKAIGQTRQQRRDRAMQTIRDLGGSFSISAGKITRVQIRAAWKGGDDGLRHLRHLPEITWLSLEDAQVTDAGLTHLTPLKNLKNLYLGHSKVKGPGLVHLKGLKNLTHLSLRYMPIEDRWLRRVGQMTHIQSLGLDDTTVTNDSLALLSGMTGLKKLWLDRSKVTGEGLTRLKPFTMLEMLDLDEIKMSDEHLAVLAHFPKLTTLYLQSTAITDRAVAHLEKVKTLRSVSLKDSGLTDEGVARLQAALPRLRVSR